MEATNSELQRVAGAARDSNPFAGLAV